MSNCKYCGKEIESKTGRMPRKYCSVECRTTYLNANKPKKRAMVKLKTHEAALREKEEIVKENEALKVLVAELRKNNPVLDRGVLKDDVKKVTHFVDEKGHKTPVGDFFNEVMDGFKKPMYPTLDSASAGETVVVTLTPNVFTPTKEDEIAKLEGELSLITGKTSLANQRRKYLEKQIEKLKYT